MNDIIIFLTGFGVGGTISFYMIYNFYKMKIMVQEINYLQEKNELLKKLNEVITLCRQKET